METVSNILRVALPGSTLKRDEKVNVYWLADAGGILFDVGWDTPESFAALQEALPHPPKHVLVTHLHPDHAGAIEQVRAWSGATIYVPREDRHVTEKELPEGLKFYDDEKQLVIEGAKIDVLLTPGHTPGHRCFHILKEGALVTGDMVLGEGTTWVGPPHGDMALYMQSLERLLHVGHRILCPGHGPIQTDPLAKIMEFLEHRRKRERQVIDALREGLRTPAQIVARNYAETPAYLHPLAQIVVHAHLTKLVGEGVARQSEHDYFLT